MTKRQTIWEEFRNEIQKTFKRMKRRLKKQGYEIEES